MREDDTTIAAGERLSRDVKSLLSDPASMSGPRRVARLSVSAPQSDLLAWLQNRPESAKVFWSNRDETFAVAGVGAACEKTGNSAEDVDGLFESMRADLSAQDEHLRYFGGLRFDVACAQRGKWAPFGTYRFIIPQLERGSRGGRHYFACNLLLPDTAQDPALAESIVSQLDVLDGDSPDVELSIPEVLARRDTPDLARWCASVRELLETYQEGTLEKVVLARESEFTLAGDADPAAVLRALMVNTPYSYHYLFQPRPGAAFVGASPERLYKRAGTFLESEAIAGTRPRGTTPEDDDLLGQDLLSSDKEVQEHRFVVDSIREFFEAQCTSVDASEETELLLLHHCQHLLARFEGILDRPNCDSQLLSDLHPTPAVGGVPRTQALERIAAMEDFERGWYTGPVGWVGHDATEFAVAIRSALVCGNTVSVYAGAGIVPGSEPEDEWDELENKVADFRGILERTRTAREAVGP